MLGNRPIPRRARFAALLTALAAGSGGLSGCDLDTTAAKNSDSLLALIPTPPSPADAARWSVDPYDPDKRYRGTELLANSPFGGESVYIDLYTQHVADPDSSVRAAAAFALGMHGGPQHVPLIVPLMKDTDRLVRLSSTRALQRLHNPVAVPALIEATRPEGRPPELAGKTGKAEGEADADIRAEAASALGQYPEPRVLQALIAALGDDRLAVTANASSSLTTLTGQSFGDDRRAWIAWEKSATDPFAGRTLYVYPYYNRDLRWEEYLPFWPGVPNEQPGSPAGIGPVAAGPPVQPPR